MCCHCTTHNDETYYIQWLNVLFTMTILQRCSVFLMCSHYYIQRRQSQLLRNFDSCGWVRLLALCCVACSVFLMCCHCTTYNDDKADCWEILTVVVESVWRRVHRTICAQRYWHHAAGDKHLIAWYNYFVKRWMHFFGNDCRQFSIDHAEWLSSIFGLAIGSMQQITNPQSLV